jgi:hypothetical protein
MYKVEHSRKLFYKVTFSALFHVDIVDVKASVACYDHDLWAAATHGYNAA